MNSDEMCNVESVWEMEVVYLYYVTLTDAAQAAATTYRDGRVLW